MFAARLNGRKGICPALSPCPCLNSIPKRHPSISQSRVLCPVTKDIAQPPRPVCCFEVKPQMSAS
jgi:hypothetical protein